MEESHDVLALEKISNEVDESQIKVILSTQCIKAQTFLLDKLKKQSERHKETCNFISNTNLKVGTEIKQAEQEIRSKLIAQETLKSANVEIRKEWLLAKTRKSDIIDRIADGKKKYEALWLECKTRYESIPFVQKLLLAKGSQKEIEQNIITMEEQITNLYNEMENKRRICAKLDEERCIELANFMVNDMPRALSIINDKIKSIDILNKEIGELLNKQDSHVADFEESSNINKIENVKDEELSGADEPKISKPYDDSLIPRLNLIHFDLDMMDVNLDQVKIKKSEYLQAIPTSTNATIHNLEKVVEQRFEKEKAFEYVSPYFKTYNEEKPLNFSDRKLINILEDININKDQVYDIVKKVNPEQLRTVDEIPAEKIVSTDVMQTVSTGKEDKSVVRETIEEIDLTSSNTENLIIPPTQFLDIALSVTPHEDITKKKVSFDLPSSMQINEIIDDKNGAEEEIESLNQTTNLDISAASDESFMKIKQMFLKKHNLDLSPQFVYAKNNVMQKKDDERPVTSKFFQNHNNDNDNTNEIDVEQVPKGKESIDIVNLQNDGGDFQKGSNEIIFLAMDTEETAASTPKPIKVNVEVCDDNKSEKPISGLLFTHGAQAIPDSLNVSMSTTGYEDSDFPHCIDASLLLSPKADVTVNGDNPEVLSQEVPNFLSGFRKNTFSFFGGSASVAENKPDSSAENEGNNNFNFNFGTEKKNRGGLFSLFH